VKIAIVAAEIGPDAKAGGLGDVIAALPPALKRAGADPCVIVPAYPTLLAHHEAALVADNLSVTLGERVESFRILRASDAAGIAIYLIDHPGFFRRDGIYGEHGVDYPDNPRRFVFFGRAAVAAAMPLAPDVIQTHDWHAAAAAIMIRADPAMRRRFANTLSIFTLHNLAFQGMLAADDFGLLGLDSSWFTADCLEFFGQVNLMKGATVLADGASTVSPTYAQEVANDPAFGFGLEGVIRAKNGRFVGILNGADYDEWDPAKDEYIPTRFTPRDRSGKRSCLYQLRKALELPDREGTALVGMVSRMTSQKGFDLLADAIDAMMELDLQLVMLANGDPGLEQIFRDAETRYRDRLRVIPEFDNRMAHRIQAGSDIFLMPSRYEPCGLTQMYALKYGTAPVVRATGGLRDTVSEFDPVKRIGNGFVFNEYTPKAMIAAMRRALAVFRQPPQWSSLLDNCFAADFSWSRAAAEYLRWFADLRRDRDEMAR
jgi:starch synthase